MRIGVDIDGVLADFNSAFIPRCIQVTGRDLFPLRPFDITTWNYPESFGYSAEEVSAVWESIKADKYFWQDLGHYDTTIADLNALQERQDAGDEIYFITARPGVLVKQQTETWIERNLYTGFDNPTVLISCHKGLCAKALDLDAYIDDKWENCIAAANTNARTFVLDRPWNRHYILSRGPCDGVPYPCAGEVDKSNGLTRVSSVSQMLALLHP